MHRLSIIINVLESYTIVNRHILHFNKMDMTDCELIIIDDGSKPPINPKVQAVFPFNIYYREDERPWTTGCARNYGASLANGDYVLMTDVDHILSQEAITSAVNFTGDKMTFPRQWGVMMEDGSISQEEVILFSYGLKKELFAERGLNAGHHPNTFVMNKELYLNTLGGYDESLCGRYGGSDTNLNKRYNALWKEGIVERSIKGPPIFVYPDPRRDVRGVFHSLKRKK